MTEKEEEGHSKEGSAFRFFAAGDKNVSLA
jgi:hypothetical protein